MSSQFYLGPVLQCGGKFISVVDQGWVEMVRGRGRSLTAEFWLKAVRSMGHIVPPYLILAGVGRVFVSMSI